MDTGDNKVSHFEYKSCSVVTNPFGNAAAMKNDSFLEQMESRMDKL